MYKKLGFELIKKTSPNYHYFDRKCHRYNRFNFRKDVLIKMGYDKSKTEFQIMNELPYYRVYDSGSLKFLFKPNLNKNL
jgi:N-acetylneuraminic acid mutarotase